MSILSAKYSFKMAIPQIPNLILYAIPLFVVSVIAESYVLLKKKPENFNIKDTFASLAMGVGNLFSGLLSKFLVVFIITFLYENYRVTTIPFVWWS